MHLAKVYVRKLPTSTVCQHSLLCFPQNDGRLRFGRQSVVYKSSKTGKVDSIPSVELSQGIKLTTSTGHIYKYDGFRDTDFEKISEYFKAHYKVELPEKELCEGGLELGHHQNPVLSKADVIQATGDAVCIFKELQCLMPRGSFLHGKTFDYKIPYTTVLRLFLLPHKDQRQMYFWCVLSLDPPIKQGQTRYHFLILLFSKEEDLSLSLNMTEEKRYGGKLSKNMSSSLYEMVSRVMKALVNRKITSQCITCSYKRGFVHIHKPPRAPACRCVNFARGTTTTTTRSLDFEIETKQGTQFTLQQHREEYGKRFDFVTAEKLSFQNRGFKEGMKGKDDMLEDSDEDQHDAYLERMKEEGKIREEANDSDDSDGESDESFNPLEEDDDVTEEYVLVFNPSLPYIYRFFPMFLSVNLFHFPLSLLLLPPSL
uniref:FACT complex subunit SSRP1 n=1 Tax=Oncorhynchus kisutch TaxID=8019 RepID=A0A8C7FW72_ONCKI